MIIYYSSAYEVDQDDYYALLQQYAHEEADFMAGDVNEDALITDYLKQFHQHAHAEPPP